ncbi:MAG: deoxyribose-phosphate aldolase [Treponema sp.]|jgi:deoxyribose-phosphate aldolase|nr:deoxyribose-phosphate aldolase [Treponema sp.]
MTGEEILRHVDHTLLKAVSSWAEIEKLCNEAIRFKTASVCVPPSYVKPIHEAFRDLNICTVIGFPLGYNVCAVKIQEAEAAMLDGASELDMVINLGDVKNGAFDKVEREISALKKTAGKNILKVIVETCYLTQEEKIMLAGIVTEAGADYIKTSTGFGSAGAAIEDVLLFRERIGTGVKIKASGGIKTREDLEKFLAAGCDRIGTSSAVALLGKP